MQQPPASDAERSQTESTPRLSYLQWGPVGAPAAALLHGVGSSSSTWAELQPLLDPSHRWIVPDYRGHGGSEAPEPPYAVDDFVDDLARVLDESGAGEVVVAGFSIGAVIALAFALEHPERVSALILLSSIAGRTPAEAERAEARLDRIRTTAPALLAPESAERWFTEAFRETRPDLVQAEVDIVSSIAQEPYAASYEVLVRTDQLDRAPEIRVPALIVTGEEDAGSTPAMSRRLAESIPGAELHVLPGLKHYIHIEAPDTVAGLVNDFLVRISSLDGPAAD